ncbi:M12 family metallopeptidase [Rugamonas sp. CCM 8940]|uniref:M12 family metallopeptidase n=1 Tax=Rugamonas sp. CCM 8940 TaxID=2765359 RepID=UPI0018F72EB9|nr:M12 family metallopeptidase [Rugamonas sp. CCM 8940]MBJ7310525.1 hypothetical protein [Rugamonas sp. CCM 8940]
MSTTQQTQYTASHDLHQCALKPIPKRTFEGKVSFDRQEIMLETEKYWANGTALKYYFYTAAGKASDVNGELDLVRSAFDAWKNIGIGLSFKETTAPDEAHIRIAFMRGEGSWSYIGRDCLGIPTSDPTMNFGWNLLTDPRTVGVAIHEIGHAIGLPHEHQNPNAGIVWNEQAVISAFSRPPNNWDEATIRNNILNKYTSGKIQGSEWDPRSIMEYAFEEGLIQLPKPYDVEGIHPPGNKLSDIDIAWTQRFYPALTEADLPELHIGASEPLDLDHGEQRSFKFSPKCTRQYELRTFGECDGVLVVFEQHAADGGEFLIGQDDSGKEDNAHLKLRLEKNKTYHINFRMLFRNADATPSIMLW